MVGGLASALSRAPRGRDGLGVRQRQRQRGRPLDTGELCAAGREDRAIRQRAGATDRRAGTGAPCGQRPTRCARLPQRERRLAAARRRNPAAAIPRRDSHFGDGRRAGHHRNSRGRRRRGGGPGNRPALPVPSNRLHRRRHQRVGPQRHRRAGVELPPRIRRGPWRAVQSGQARQKPAAKPCAPIGAPATRRTAPDPRASYLRREALRRRAIRRSRHSSDHRRGLCAPAAVR